MTSYTSSWGGTSQNGTPIDGITRINDWGFGTTSGDGQAISMPDFAPPSINLPSIGADSVPGPTNPDALAAIMQASLLEPPVEDEPVGSISDYSQSIWSFDYWVSSYMSNLKTEVTTAGKTITETGAEMGNFVGEHAARTWYEPGEELEIVVQGVTDTTNAAIDFAEQAVTDPLGTAAEIGNGAIDFLDEVTTDPEAAGRALGNGAVAWATMPVGAGVAKGVAVVGKGIKRLGTALKAADKVEDVLDKAEDIADATPRCKKPNGGCFAAGTLVWAVLPEQEEAFAQQIGLQSATVNAADSQQSSATIAARSIEQAVPIEQLPLGARVVTRNPYRSDIDLSLPEPDQSTWSKLSIVLTTEAGLIVDAELFRPTELLDQLDLAAGRTMYFSVPELELNSWGTVSSIEPSPEIVAGEGHVITARFRTRQVEQMTRVTLADGNEIIGTMVHSAWSADRQDWVALSELQVGEHLQSRSGTIEI
ncbi:MAG: hypothetical protein KDB00_07110, partial [Planctomycetales bacterium]|nr:hypothetical protein [Planctomycetales bacterium]